MVFVKPVRNSEYRQSANMRLYVGHLPYDTRTRDLERAFGEFGDLRDIDIHNGYAFVEYYERADAKDAVR